MKEFDESGMHFTFADDDCFRIEEDDVVISKGHIMACECVAKIFNGRRNLFFFIEAKSSAPRDPICDMNLVCYNGRPLNDKWTIKTNFDRFVDDICQKFQDSYSLCRAVSSNHHGDNARNRMPLCCHDIRHDNVRFALIINGFKDEWCAPLNDAIKKRMRHFLNAWNIVDISVCTFNCASAAMAHIPVTDALCVKRED